MPFRIGKYFLTSLDLEQRLPALRDVLTRASGRPPAIVASRGRALVVDVEPAAVEMRRRSPDAVLERRLLHALVERMRAARPELAARRRLDQRRRRALDRVQPVGLRPVEPRDRAEQAPRVGHLRVVEELARLGLLDDPAGVHDDDLVGDVGDDAEIVRDQDHRRVELVLQAADQLDDLRLDRHVERGRRLVGDQHVRVAGERHRDHRPLAHAARELVRVVVDARLGVRDADLREQLDGALAPALRRPSRALGSSRRSGRRCGRPGSATVIGSWKIIPISSPRTSASSRRTSPSRSSPLYITSPGTSRSRRACRPISVIEVTLLPEPDSPTMPEHLAALELERDAVDGADDAVLGGEVHAEVVDLEKALCH